ncbi:MAG: VWA domain-containing protein [Epsilonproteobacteria bacterium]|nr:VWA domain-containing protein [Campylobacterota bacterium]
MSYTFEYPVAFLLLIIYFLCIKYCKAKLKSLFFPNIALLENITAKRGYFLSIIRFLAFFMLVFALASPIKKDDIIFNKQKGYEISLILDASGSMQQYNKFGIVKEIVKDFIKKRKNDKLSLTIFADFAYVAVPLTYDKKSILSLLDRIEVGVAGKQRTALYEALFLSTRVFQNSKAKDKIAILLTDGMDNTNSVPLEVAINTAKKFGIKVYTIGIGDYDRAVLKKIAKETGGKFFSANSKADLQRIYEEIDRLEKSEFKATKYIKKSYYYQYFLALGIVFLIIYILVYRK